MPGSSSFIHGVTIATILAKNSKKKTKKKRKTANVKNPWNIFLLQIYNNEIIYAAILEGFLFDPRYLFKVMNIKECEKVYTRF
jgi:hypothetical protein